MLRIRSKSELHILEIKSHTHLSTDVRMTRGEPHRGSTFAATLSRVLEKRAAALCSEDLGLPDASSFQTHIESDLTLLSGLSASNL